MLTRKNHLPSGSVAYVGLIDAIAVSWNPIPWKSTRWAVEEMRHDSGEWGQPRIVATFATADAANTYCHNRRCEATEAAS